VNAAAPPSPQMMSLSLSLSLSSRIRLAYHSNNLRQLKLSALKDNFSTSCPISVVQALPTLLSIITDKDMNMNRIINRNMNMCISMNINMKINMDTNMKQEMNMDVHRNTTIVMFTYMFFSFIFFSRFYTYFIIQYSSRLSSRAGPELAE
jgi:hypothetical protein